MRLVLCSLFMLYAAAATIQAASEVAAPQPQICSVQDEVPADENAQEGDNFGEDSIDEDVNAPSFETRGYSEAVKSAVKEAESAYRKAVIHYGEGNEKKAEELFRKSLEALSSAGLDAYGLFSARAGLDKMFQDFNILFAENEKPANGGRKYSIPIDKDNEQVKKYLALYSSGKCKSLIQKALERSGRYRPMILKVLKEYGLPRELVYLPVVESLYNVNDRSHAGALGLWQLMPSRARCFDIKMNYWIDERKDPEKSTRAAAQYLRDLFYMFDNWHLALAAYNRGEYGLARDLQFSKATNIQEMSERNAVPKETELFVPQFIACTIIGDNPAAYGYELNYDEPLKYDEVATDRIIDLEVVAKCAETDAAGIRELNPALKAWCTPHNYEGFILKIPYGKKDAFLANLAQVKELNPSRGYVKYRIERGDCLSKIAKKFNTSVTALTEDNRIKNPKHLRIGQVLMVRPGRKYYSNKKG